MIRRPTRTMRAIVTALVLALVAPACALIDRGSTYDIVAFFPRAVSLYESGAVQVLGLPAGEISDIEVVGNQVKVTMAIDSDIPVPADAMAAIVPQSLIGERRIQLFPAYQEGDPEAQDGHTIASENTIIPVEPDQALAALKEFLDSLDPEGLGRLIDNAATTLDGQGENLGLALEELSELVGNIEANDDDIISIAERFDDFTQALLTRESDLARSLDDFATVTQILADERQNIENFISALADLSTNSLDLVSEHAVRLRTDIKIVARLTAAIDTNLDGVQQILDGNRAVMEGFLDAYNPELQAFTLRTSLGPLVGEALAPVLEDLGLDGVLPCIPVDTPCPDSPAITEILPLDAGAAAAEETGAVDAELAAPTSPVRALVTLLGSPVDAAGESGRSSTHDPASPWERLVGTFVGVGS